MKCACGRSLPVHSGLDCGPDLPRESTAPAVPPEYERAVEALRDLLRIVSHTGEGGTMTRMGSEDGRFEFYLRLIPCKEKARAALAAVDAARGQR